MSRLLLMIACLILFANVIAAMRLAGFEENQALGCLVAIIGLYEVFKICWYDLFPEKQKGGKQ